tara:strand:+ start:16543 stop:16911 length:369 start_codon:yes stop_codon:yes gene_type:complete
MTKTLGVRLPITRDDSDGFTMIHRLADMYRQNLKMLVLTNPGERIMEPNFGVGMSTYLFESFSDGVASQIDSKIREQATIYMPNLDIKSIKFGESKDSGMLAVLIEYKIANLGMSDSITITI